MSIFTTVLLKTLITIRTLTNLMTLISSAFSCNKYINLVITRTLITLISSVFSCTKDDESARLWSKVAGWGSGAEAAGKIVRFGAADNYWSMGEGPGNPNYPNNPSNHKLPE
jgi:hypothetical protein